MCEIKRRQFWFLIAILAMLATPAMADITYMSEVAFTGAIQPGYYLQNLKGLSGIQSTINGGVFSGVSSRDFAGNGFSYTVSAVNSYGDVTGLYEVPDGLSTWLSYDVLTFTFTGPKPVTAVGGTFFANGNSGNTVNSNVEVLLSDGTQVMLTTPGFRGFTSNVAIDSLKVWSDVGLSQHTDGTMYAGAGELYVGTAVPDGGATLMLLGGAFAGLAALRRKLS